MAAYYPLFFDLAGKLCVVVGGGRVAERKVHAILRSGARVKLVSPVVTKDIARLSGEGRLELVPREYCRGDLKGAALVFAATDSGEVNREVREESSRLAIPLNAADNPGLCDFIVPSVVKKGPIHIAISTSGLLPMLSRKLRKEVMEALAADYAAYARRVGTFRRLLVKTVKSGRLRREVMKRLGEADVAEVARMSPADMKRRFLGPGED
ncbi:MAG: bifunctional precorrin-2 dehydrogenase/sirohydrochlorin ferrochelatase [Syntrophorhabdales bacterium]|jgi:siroheme synthase-like protein